jgi:NADH-quinone oxidoreductase subunit N
MKRQRLVLFEFVTFLALSFIGLLVLCLSYDFLGFYLALELQTLAFYVLASYRTDSDFSIEAGLKYFVSGSFASGLLLFSIALLYLSSGTLSFETLKNLVDSSVCNNLDIVILGYFFLLVSLLFKVGAVPFHMWLPDVYEGSSITVTFFFATVPKIALFFALLKIGIIIFGFTNNFIASIAHFAAICSIILAAVAALYQKKLKRLIAYSAISHSGFLLLGIAANSLLSFKVTTFYVLVYCGISICFFTMILTTANIHFTFFKYLVN